MKKLVNRHNKMQGFTLIEVIVVVMILLILVTVVAPKLISMGSPPASTQMTPLMTQTRYFEHYGQDIVVVTTKTQGDFFIINNGPAQYQVEQHINGFCTIEYYQDTAWMGNAVRPVRVITNAICE